MSVAVPGGSGAWFRTWAKRRRAVVDVDPAARQVNAICQTDDLFGPVWSRSSADVAGVDRNAHQTSPLGDLVSTLHGMVGNSETGMVAWVRGSTDRT